MDQVKPHALVDVYAVQAQSFNPSVGYYVAEVSSKGLKVGKNQDPFGIVGYGDDEKAAKDDAREQLKECGFSKKQVEYRRV